MPRLRAKAVGKIGTALVQSLTCAADQAAMR